MTASGIAAAVNELGAGEVARGEIEPVDQIEMFDEIDAQEVVATAAKSWRPGMGRKPGSRNRTTQLVIQYVQKRGRDPLIALASVVSMSPAQIRETFGLDCGEAAEFWRKCVAELAPYLHSRQPQAIVMPPSAGFAPIFLQFAYGAPAANDAPTIEGAARSKLTEEFQQLSAEAQEQVAWPRGRMEALTG